MYIQPNTAQQIELDPVSNIEVSSIISSLKITKTNVNEISVNIFKKYHSYFLDCLCEIINLCFVKGVFPDCLKNATVIPIYKKGSPSDMSCYTGLLHCYHSSAKFSKDVYSIVYPIIAHCTTFLLPPNLVLEKAAPHKMQYYL